MDDDPRPLDVLDVVVINLRGAKKTPAVDGGPVGRCPSGDDPPNLGTRWAVDK